jgi:hypothetical protein
LPPVCCSVWMCCVTIACSRHGAGSIHNNIQQGREGCDMPYECLPAPTGVPRQ